MHAYWNLVKCRSFCRLRASKKLEIRLGIQLVGRCKYEQLKEIEPALDEIRKFKDLKEPKPGIFYLKSQGFLHFHEKDEKIWADVRDGKDWGASIDLPVKLTKGLLSKFVREIRDRYLNSGGNL